MLCLFWSSFLYSHNSATFKIRGGPPFHIYRQQVFCTARFVKIGGEFRHLATLEMTNKGGHRGAAGSYPQPQGKKDAHFPPFSDKRHFKIKKKAQFIPLFLGNVS